MRDLVRHTLTEEQIMVMNAEVDWAERCKAWGRAKADYFAAQQALDDAMSLYVQASGPPPGSKAVLNVDDMRCRMLEARAAVDAFIASHTVDDREKTNLPLHE